MHIKKDPATQARVALLTKTERRHMANVRDHIELLGDNFAEVKELATRYATIVELIEKANGAYSTPVYEEEAPPMPQDAHETPEEPKPKGKKQDDIPF